MDERTSKRRTVSECERRGHSPNNRRRSRAGPFAKRRAIYGTMAIACEKRIKPLAASAIRMVAYMLTVTGAVATSNWNVCAEAGTVTVSGTDASESSLVLSAICQPPGGAGVASVAVHCIVVPPFGIVDGHVNPAIF